MGFEIGNKEAKKGDHKRQRMLTRRLMAALNEPIAILPADAPCEHRVIHSLISRAMEGDVPAVREIFDRVEGKVSQPVEVTKNPFGELSTDELNDLVQELKAGGEAGSAGDGAMGAGETPTLN
jgi:hypothetical protein